MPNHRLKLIAQQVIIVVLYVTRFENYQVIANSESRKIIKTILCF